MLPLGWFRVTNLLTVELERQPNHLLGAARLWNPHNTARTHKWVTAPSHRRWPESSLLLARGDLAPFYRHEKTLWFVLVIKLSDLWSTVGSEWFSRKRLQPSLWRLQWTRGSSLSLSSQALFFKESNCADCLWVSQLLLQTVVSCAISNVTLGEQTLEFAVFFGITRETYWWKLQTPCQLLSKNLSAGLGGDQFPESVHRNFGLSISTV